jgi:lipopolysaccharide transport system ATP-binding protein
MSDVVIRAEGLGKAYQIRHQAESGHTRFSEMLSDRARHLFCRNRDAGPTHETFWALRDVSFDIREGEVVGVIGEGRVEIRGRVASLLEVGTGFHPELTGRENIFLNGAILGMSRAEIRRKFDEIIDFAGVEKFLDTPVKRYSNGMYVRLAFAVAAHLEPEVLIVDEVLAVGDAEFQRKCLGKMGEVAKGGRTVLFVSHNLLAVQQLCGRSLLLVDGSLEVMAATLDVIGHYQSSLGSKLRRDELGKLSGTRKPAEIVDIEAFRAIDGSTAQPVTWESCIFRIHYRANALIAKSSLVFYIHDMAGHLLQLCSTRPDSNVEFSILEGNHYTDLEFPCLMLAEGTYMIGAGLAFPGKSWIDNHPILKTISVVGRDVFSSGLVPRQERYPIVLPHHWHISDRTTQQRRARAVD